MSADLKDVAFYRCSAVIVEGVCQLCQEPVRGPLFLGWGIVPEGRALILAVADEAGAHPLDLVAERDIPDTVEVEA